MKYKINDKLIITNKITGHGFDIGDKVRVLSVRKNIGDYLVKKYEKHIGKKLSGLEKLTKRIIVHKKYYVRDEEVKLVE